MPTRDVEAANQYQSYVMGWKHAATTKAMDPVFTGHPNLLLREAYALGYRDGRVARNSALENASALYSHEPRILRLAEPGLTEDG